MMLVTEAAPMFVSELAPTFVWGVDADARRRMFPDGRRVAGADAEHVVARDRPASRRARIFSDEVLRDDVPLLVSAVAIDVLAPAPRRSRRRPRRRASRRPGRDSEDRFALRDEMDACAHQGRSASCAHRGGPYFLPDPLRARAATPSSGRPRMPSLPWRRGRVGLDGLRAQEERRGDLAVRAARGRLLRDTRLGLCQVVRAPSRSARRSSSARACRSAPGRSAPALRQARSSPRALSPLTAQHLSWTTSGQEIDRQRERRNASTERCAAADAGRDRRAATSNATAVHADPRAGAGRWRAPARHTGSTSAAASSACRADLRLDELGQQVELVAEHGARIGPIAASAAAKSPSASSRSRGRPVRGRGRPRSPTGSIGAGLREWPGPPRPRRERRGAGRYPSPGRAPSRCRSAGKVIACSARRPHSSPSPQYHSSAQPFASRAAEVACSAALDRPVDDLVQHLRIVHAALAIGTAASAVGAA